MSARMLVLLAAAAVAAAGLSVPGAADTRDDQHEWSLTPERGHADDKVRVADDMWRLAEGHPNEGSLRRHEWGMAALDFPPTTLDDPVISVAATIDAATPPGTAAEVDVRSLRGDGSWSEWVPAGATLPERSDTVQVRLLLTSDDGARSPAVERIDLSATEDPSRSSMAEASRAGGADIHRVFATREGLVGGTTANGHVITEDDHFVALPSRRGLSARGTGDYSVRVCTGTRCAWAPVWDVGPWNTKDDYWNADREMWPDLPRGKPQAQAAYSDGHNDGKDQFDRKVANPAGIDLADGTFRDGLGLRDNAWVEVTYLWTGSGAWGTVDSSVAPLNVRSAAKRTATQVGLAADRAQVRIECATTGQRVTGSQGTTDKWLQVADGMFVSAAYVKTHGTAPRC